jgi:hypothetical protein
MSIVAPPGLKMCLSVEPSYNPQTVTLSLLPVKEPAGGTQQSGRANSPSSLRWGHVPWSAVVFVSEIRPIVRLGAS